jgi:hypothetical protein
LAQNSDISAQLLLLQLRSSAWEIVPIDGDGPKNSMKPPRRHIVFSSSSYPIGFSKPTFSRLNHKSFLWWFHVGLHSTKVFLCKCPVEINPPSTLLLAPPHLMENSYALQLFSAILVPWHSHPEIKSRLKLSKILLEKSEILCHVI